MARIVLICPEPVREVVQGIGIRFLEMAIELRRDHEVSLWVPNSNFPKEYPFKVLRFPDRDFPDHLRDVDVVVTHGHISERYFEALDRNHLGEGPPLVIDLYDPFLIENLRYTELLGEELFYKDRQVLFRQLMRGDFFLVSSETQRLFYIGVLTGVGRLCPRLYHVDPTLRSLIDVAPFGVRPMNPEDENQAGGKLKGAVPGIGPDDLVLFFGGIYDWYDPILLLDTLVGIVQTWPNLRVIFSLNPNRETTPQTKFREVRARSDHHGWTGRHIFFLPWFPYQDRFAYFRDVDLAVSLHEPSLETDLSLRTRLLEYLNSGVPVIATEGGETDRILRSSGGGKLVAPKDTAALSRELVRLLDNRELRRSMGQKGQDWVHQHMMWNVSLKPLAAFCSQPRKSSTSGETGLPYTMSNRITLSRVYRYWRQNGSRAVFQRVARHLTRGNCP